MRILSLALNLPGPAALMRLHAMGATCVKVEPPAGDPLRIYSPQAYDQLHQGVRVIRLDLKSESGRAQLDLELAHTDVLLTSFREAALTRLGLSWPVLHAQFPRLSQVAVVGHHGALAHRPGHDLTYQAAHGLVKDLATPASLLADMGGALLITEAVLQLQLARQSSGQGARLDVALDDAAAWLAWPQAGGLMNDDGVLSGRHAGYRVFPCLDGRVAVAVLEPHFARALCQALGLETDWAERMTDPLAHHALAARLATQTCAALDTLAEKHDLPLQTMPA